MANTEIGDSIRTYIQTNFMVADFDDNDSFLETGIIDSLGVIDLMLFVESEYGIKVNPRDVTPENFDSLDRLVDFVARRTEDDEQSE